MDWSWYFPNDHTHDYWCRFPIHRWGYQMAKIRCLLKGISWQVKSFILPGKAVMAKKIHHVTELKITDDVLRITGAFVFTYFVIYI